MRLTDADALVAELQKKPIHDGHFIHTRDVSDAIFYAPTISPDEVRGVGEWIYCHSDMEYKCSLCGKQLDDYVNASEWAGLSEIPNYCPNCGARMKGAKDGTTD